MSTIYALLHVMQKWWAHWGAPLLSVLVLVVFAYQSSALTWLLVTPATLSVAAVPDSAVGDTEQQPQISGAILASRHLFGDKPRQVVTVPARPRKRPPPVAKKRQLALTLVGILDLGEGGDSLAIIRHKRKDVSYRAGDRLPENSWLQTVESDWVEVAYTGGTQVLSLENRDVFKRTDGGASSGRSKSDPARDRSNRELSVPLEDIRADDLSPRQIRDLLVKDPLDFSKQVNIIPERRDGQIYGYRFRPRKAENRTVVSKLGLMEEDIVLEVNGIKLNSTRNGLSVLRRIDKSEIIELMVERDGISIPIFIDLQ